MKLLHVASEVAPWAQTGGLGQVVAALPAALAAAGDEVAVVAPLYRGVRERAAALGAPLDETDVAVSIELDGRPIAGRFVAGRAGGARVFLLDAPLFFDRPGLYGDGGVDYPDNAFRFAFLARAALAAAPRLCGGPPDVVHGHDWQAGLIGPALRGVAGGRPRAVFTIHNLAFQGLFPKHLVPALGLPWTGFRLDGFEFFDKLSFLKAGAAFADAITTVSPGYAREITTPPFGCGLDGFFRKHGAIGIANGIDVGAWDPADDPHLAAPFAAAAPAGRAACRRALVDALGLPDAGLLLGVVSRLTEQKGIDLIAELGDALPGLGARLIVLGSGDRALEGRLAALAAARPDHVVLRIGFDDGLARRIFAGVDAVLMPSRFEPCGLAQLQAMRYGALPIVNPVGGLGDTVHDPGDAGLARGEGTGFHLTSGDRAGLIRAVARAAALRGDRAGWGRAVAAAMARDSSWRAPAAAYQALYRRLVARGP